MSKFLTQIVSIMNDFHDIMIDLVDIHAHPHADKWLHFFIMAIVGMIIFTVVHALIKFLSKYGLAVISFVFTFTLLVVIVFAIELQQGITGRGNMEFADIAWGLGGFLCVFGLYIGIKRSRNGRKRDDEKSKDKIVQGNIIT